MTNETQICSFKDLVIENNIVRCQVCDTLLQPLSADEQIQAYMEESPQLEF